MQASVGPMVTSMQDKFPPVLSPDICPESAIGLAQDDEALCMECWLSKVNENIS